MHRTCTDEDEDFGGRHPSLHRHRHTLLWRLWWPGQNSKAEREELKRVMGNYATAFLFRWTSIFILKKHFRLKRKLNFRLTEKIKKRKKNKETKNK